jgi:hypothetical protein
MLVTHKCGHTSEYVSGQNPRFEAGRMAKLQGKTCTACTTARVEQEIAVAKAAKAARKAKAEADRIANLPPVGIKFECWFDGNLWHGSLLPPGELGILDKVAGTGFSPGKLFHNLLAAVKTVITRRKQCSTSAHGAAAK